MFILHIAKSLVLKDNDNNIIELSIESRNSNSFTVDKITKDSITITTSGEWYESFTTEEFHIRDFIDKVNNSNLLEKYNNFGKVKEYKLKNYYLLYSPHTNDFYKLGEAIHLTSTLYNISGFFRFMSVERGNSGTHIVFISESNGEKVIISNPDYILSKSTGDIEHVPFYDDYVDTIYY